MKTKFRGLALTAMLMSSTSITYAEQGANSVGDLAGFGEEAYFHEDATYAENAAVAPTAHVGDSHVGDLPPAADLAEPFRPDAYQSVGISELQGEYFPPFDPSYGDVAHAYGPACDDACDAACGKKRKLFDLLDRLDCDCWATTEALIWFTPDRDMPALITTSDPGTLPLLPEGGSDNVRTVFGDDIDGEVSGGVRVDVGKYLTKNFGIGGRAWWIANSNDSYSAQGDGSEMSIGRPFYNVDIPSDDALLIALDPLFTGAIAARSELKLWGAEAYGRARISHSKSARMDLIGGYSHFEIEDTLAISSQTITNATARIRQYADLFQTDNRFDGGQVGFEMVMNHGRWMARSLTKVHLGNMNQRVRIAGVSSDQTPPAGANITSGGLLAMGNQGDFSRDVFAFVPEANFKLGYRVRNNISLSVGYSLIYWDNVTLVGDVIDTDVAGSSLNTGQFGNRPAFEFDDSSLWVQGVDFGVVIDI